jgi:AcrR family transcriptional regulator
MTTRIRRSAADARQRILETAERLLIAGGPDAVRVQVVARELGVTDAAVHHHFGNREGLLEALARHGARRLKTELADELERWTSGEVDFEGFATRVLDTMEARGYARLVMWLTLSGWASRAAFSSSPWQRTQASCFTPMPGVWHSSQRSSIW